MSLTDKINHDIKKAMLSKDREALDALRAIKNALLVQKTEKGASSELDEATEVALLKRLVKQRTESAEMYLEQGREDLARAEQFQQEVIQAYLPEQMSAAQIEEVVDRLISELGAQGMKDMGKVMGKAAKELAGKADNKMVSDIVKQKLS